MGADFEKQAREQEDKFQKLMAASQKEQEAKWKSQLETAKLQEQTRIQELESKMKSAAENDPQVAEIKNLRKKDLERIAELEKKLASDTDEIRKSQQEQL